MPALEANKSKKLYETLSSSLEAFTIFLATFKSQSIGI